MSTKIREMLEDEERQTLSPKAVLSAETKGRSRHEEECDIRPAFQRDRDRIIHSKSFRRLKHKTQVFLATSGDHYRTRLTHTLEVSQIARTIARSLQLNETLTEAIALGHDLGHTPFGHAGEAVLDKVFPPGFKHWEQSLRVVEHLEKDGRGLNLTYEVREGIMHHSKGSGPIYSPRCEGKSETLEGNIVRLADTVAYVNHDLDDAIRAGIVKSTAKTERAFSVLGKTPSQRIDTMVKDVVTASLEHGLEAICMSPGVLEATEELREFLFQQVYYKENVFSEFTKASKIVEELYHHFVDNPEEITRREGWELRPEGKERLACDFIAGMTDRFAMRMYKEIFLPSPWLEQESF
jgi:dGTPase